MQTAAERLRRRRQACRHDPPERRPAPVLRLSGYTLMEMLMVLFIVGLLVTVVVGLYWHAQEAANRRRAMADLGLLQHAIEQFYLEFGAYPRFANQAVDATLLLNLEADTFIAPGSPPPANWFARRLPAGFDAVDPWRNPYRYAHDPGDDDTFQDTYRLYSRGPDGEDHTDDDVHFQP